MKKRKRSKVQAIDMTIFSQVLLEVTSKDEDEYEDTLFENTITRHAHQGSAHPSRTGPSHHAHNGAHSSPARPFNGVAPNFHIEPAKVVAPNFHIEPSPSKIFDAILGDRFYVELNIHTPAVLDTLLPHEKRLNDGSAAQADVQPSTATGRLMTGDATTEMRHAKAKPVMNFPDTVPAFFYWNNTLIPRWIMLPSVSET
ncbi:hypothetical protein A4X13_0g7596 [Tilletia indica]|uniref:Uncharacterized protein n=1 Tax=Tilletia indica TaxID=43049 RepID=A0A177T424_9BASI|nr:hypothetical protein A4X13_0g7596 [Tilletia indica]